MITLKWFAGFGKATTDLYLTILEEKKQHILFMIVQCIRDLLPSLLGEQSFLPQHTGPSATASRYTLGGHRSAEPATHSGGGGLLQGMEQAGSSLLRAVMSLVPTIRFTPWPPNDPSPPEAERRQDGGGLRRIISRASVPADGRDAADWRPLFF